MRPPPGGTRCCAGQTPKRQHDSEPAGTVFSKARVGCKLISPPAHSGAGGMPPTRAVFQGTLMNDFLALADELDERVKPLVKALGDKEKYLEAWLLGCDT